MKHDADKQKSMHRKVTLTRHNSTRAKHTICLAHTTHDKHSYRHSQAHAKTHMRTHTREHSACGRSDIHMPNRAKKICRRTQRKKNHIHNHPHTNKFIRNTYIHTYRITPTNTPRYTHAHMLQRARAYATWAFSWAHTNTCTSAYNMPNTPLIPKAPYCHIHNTITPTPTPTPTHQHTCFRCGGLPVEQ